MKAIKRWAFLYLVAPLIRLVYQKYRPIVVVITGSVGKTTTTEVVAQLLRAYFPVKDNLKSGNTEWGVALAILNPEVKARKNKSGELVITPLEAIESWLIGLARFFLPLRYPKICVYELGVQYPGDMKVLNSLMKYDVAVLTLVGQTHREYFPTQADLMAEKTDIFRGLKPTGLAILGGDQSDIQELVNKEISPKRLTLVGQATSDQVRFQLNQTTCQIATSEGQIEMTLPIGRQWAPAVSLATAVGIEFGLTLDQIKSALAAVEPIKGRFIVHKLGRGIVLADDTYNASFDSIRLAIEGLEDLGPGRKVAVLGGIKELGAIRDEVHMQVGEFVAQHTDLLIQVGDYGRKITEGARRAGMPTDNIIELPWVEGTKDSTSAVASVLPHLLDSDRVLVKASRSVGLDVLVEGLIKAIGSNG